jgi:hypothetical protein
MTRGGIFGISLSGKTTLAKKISRAYNERLKMPSLVLDPFLDDWGIHSTAAGMDKEEDFWQTIWQTKNCLVIVDEASTTLKRDRELVPVFTSLRHRGHKLLVIGHHGADLLPVMREQLDTLYLFRQNLKSAKTWAEKLADERVLESANLGQYEYLYCENFQPPKKFKSLI